MMMREGNDYHDSNASYINLSDCLYLVEIRVKSICVASVLDSLIQLIPVMLSAACMGGHVMESEKLDG